MPDTQLSPLQADEKPTTEDINATTTLVLALEKIESREDFKTVGDAWTAMKAKESFIENWWKPRKRKAKEVHDQMCNDERAMLSRIRTAISHASRLMDRFRREEVERNRLAAVNEAVAQTKQKEERITREAATLKEAGRAMNDPEMEFQAEDMLARAAEPGALSTPIRAEEATPAVPGMTMKDVWVPGVKSVGQLIRTMADNPDYWGLFELNESAAKKFAEMYKDRLPVVIPGMSVEFKSVPAKTRGKA